MQERYDTDSLRSAGGAFSARSEELAGVVQRLQGSLLDVTAMCGNDEPGQRFAGTFEPAAVRLNRFLADLAGRLDSTGDGLRTMAGDLERADDDSTACAG
jgi:uncharacterized protein YukE